MSGLPVVHPAQRCACVCVCVRVSLRQVKVYLIPLFSSSAGTKSVPSQTGSTIALSFIPFSFSTARC